MVRVGWARIFLGRERWITNGGFDKVTMKSSTAIVKMLEWSWLTLSQDRERWTGDLYVLFPSNARPYVSTFRSNR